MLPTADNLSQTRPGVCFHGVSICFSFLFVYELEERSVPHRTEEAPGLLVLELQTAVNLPTLVLKTELGSSGGIPLAPVEILNQGGSQSNHHQDPPGVKSVASPAQRL